MPRRKCHLNVTLEIPQREEIRRISRESNLREATTYRMLLQQRLDLERAGWRFRDKELARVLEMAVSLDSRGRGVLLDFLRELFCPPVSMEEGPAEGLVTDSHFQTGVCPERREATG